MLNIVSENLQKILRKNERNLTEQRGNEVYKIPQNPKAEQVLKNEKNYMESFLTRGGKNWKMPIQEEIREDGKIVLRMPHYPGEVMATLKEKVEKWEDYLPLLEQVLELATDMREKYEIPTQSQETNEKNEKQGFFADICKKCKRFTTNIRNKALSKVRQRFPNIVEKIETWSGVLTMEKDTVKRFGKYLVGTGVKVTKDNVLSILDKKEPQVKMSDFAKLSAISLKNLLAFTTGANEEYKIHGCLHLEHIRIDTDGKLVPIDFEHGANYPRRHKYQDEAYIYQNLLQYFPNHKVANDFLVLWLRSVNMENENERELVRIALNEKILGGLYEMHATNSEGFKDGITQHMNFAKDFDEKISKFRM